MCIIGGWLLYGLGGAVLLPSVMAADAAFVTFLVATIAVFTSSTDAAQVKNVLFLAVDDLRPELNVYGYDFIKSPNIDKLAGKSLLFERAYCQLAVCSPSRASLLTGRRPDTIHVWQIKKDEYWRTTVPNATNATTIPQYFKENGYISIGMGKIFHPGPASGYDDVEYSWSPESLPYYHADQNVSSAGGVSWHSFNRPDDKLNDGMIADNAVKVLQQLKQNRTRKGDKRPFFMAVGFHKPHLPFYCPSKYYDLYPSVAEILLPDNPDPPTNYPPIAYSIWKELKGFKDIGELINRTICDNDANISLRSRNCHLPERKIRELRRAYYSCISYTDAQIGRVIDELHAQELDNDTVIVLWADHGWQLGEHNEWGKNTNFEDATRVPFMIHVPGVTDSGMHTDALVELVDIFPSITEIAGIEKPPLCNGNDKPSIACVEGSSVAPLLKDPNQTWKKGAFSQYPRPAQGFPSIPGHPAFPAKEQQESVMGYTVRVDKYRFTEWYRFNHTTSKPHFDQVWGTELYHHSSSNGSSFFNDENINIASQTAMQDTVEELRKLVQAGWRTALPPN